MSKSVKSAVNSANDNLNHQNNELPKDVWKEINKYLTPEELLKNRQVSQFWKANAEEPLKQKLIDGTVSLADKKTPAIYAIVNGQNDIFKEFYNSVSKDLSTQYVFDFLKAAILSNNHEIKELLITTHKGYKGELSPVIDGKTPLHHLIDKKDEKGLKLALENNFNPNFLILSKNSTTPLKYALKTANIPAISILLRFNASLSKCHLSKSEIKEINANPAIASLVKCEKIIREAERLENLNTNLGFFEKRQLNKEIRLAYTKAAKLSPTHFSLYVSEHCNRDKSNFSEKKINLLHNISEKMTTVQPDDSSHLSPMIKSPSQ